MFFSADGLITGVASILNRGLHYISWS